MKYLSQFCVIMVFSLLGEGLQRLIPIPIPASLYGIFLLFGALCLKIVKLEQVCQTGAFLRSIIPILFVPSIVGILEHWAEIQGATLAILLITLVSTMLTFGISGRTAQSTAVQGGDHRD